MTAILAMALAAGLLVPVCSSAQTGDAKQEPDAKSAPAPVPLAHFVQRDKLALYVEFAGLKNHEAEWKATAAYKMLTGTPLGVMLEQVAGQLLDKAIAPFPNKTLTGPEIVTLIKHAADSGFVLALNGDAADGALRRTIVLRGAASKELRPLSSRLMKWLMGDDKPRMEWKASRPVVLVSKEASTSTKEGWAWWAEKDDLAVATPISTVDHVLAAIDGSAPSAVDHPLVESLKKPEGEFHPVGIAFIDPSAPIAGGSPIASIIKHMKDSWGLTRIDVRHGFEANALVTSTRLVAPKPRKGAAAAFDQPTFAATGLIPTPEGVGSFLELSLKPAEVLAAATALDPSGSFKSRVDAIYESIRSGGKVDVDRDVLAHIGPRMILYLAPGRTAAAADDAPKTAIENGLDVLALVSGLQTHFPKLTLAAEVSDPETLGKSLDTVMVAVNKELKAQTLEKAAEAREAEKAKNAGGRPGGGESGTGKRSAASAAPQFTVSPSSNASKSYVLTTPRNSPLQLGPSGFRPTVLLEGKYLVISTSSDGARGAMTALKGKNWKPAESTSQAIGHAPEGLIALGVIDTSDGLPSFLASFPGTIQSMVNTALAVAKNRATAAAAKPGTPPPGGAPGANASVSVGQGGEGGGRRGRGGPGGLMVPGAPGGPGFGPGFGGGQSPNNANGSGLTNDEMLTLSVESDKLPKPEDLKASLFPSLYSISVTDQEIRFTSRSAFPNLGSPLGAIAGVFLLPKLFQAREAATAAASPPAAAQNQATPGAPGAPGQPAAAPGVSSPGGAPGASAPGGSPPGGRGGRRGRGGPG